MTVSKGHAGNRSLLIAGAGIPGLTLALALKAAHGDILDVIVCDPGLAAGAARHHGRAFAIAAGPRRMFERLGVWDRIASGAQPIRDMVISDGRLADPVRPTFLTFAQEAESEADEPFAHMVEALPLVETLRESAEAAGVRLLPTGVLRASPDGGRMHLTLGQGDALSVTLLVAADGARSRLREAAGIGWIGWDYPQSGIVATIGHERDHEGRAVEHFLPSGPFAILPLKARGPSRHRSSIVWTERKADTAALIGTSPEDALVEIERRFGLGLGRLTLEDPPSAYPLSFGFARRFHAERIALLGDAAHVIHPIAGQGLNLGLSGAAALAEAITDAMRLGIDPGSRDVLREYERARRFDALSMAAATDGLNRLFSNDLLPVRLARDLGLGLVDRMPALKRYFIAEASARRGTQPRLLQGEAL